MRLALLAATVLFTTVASAQTPAPVTSTPLAPVATATPAAPTMATPTPTPPVVKPVMKPKAPVLTVEQRFEKANASHDGKLTKAQATAAKWTTVSRNFATIDKDKKGYVTVDDIKAAAAKKPAPKKTATPLTPAAVKP